MSKMFCPSCGSTDIEQHGASGASICTACGVVVEENAIVSSVEFMEGAGGSSSMMGQYVGPNGSKPFSRDRGRGASGYGFSRDSRETTLANGRRRIQDVASRLRLSSHFVDAAHRYFTIAVEKNFVQGRRTTHVVAACLYIACRQEKSQHMLIDFSDALQVNVYTLGTTFLKFRRLLGLRLEIIDPALYIYRFAAHLDLEDQANAVVLTALRLVGRMKRDWIVSGRRPAGICAAALLIAARAHGFTKQHQDVTKILRVCGMTVTARVKEFESTPSANLTLDQFMDMDYDLVTAADPPRFTSNRIREARAVAIQDGNVDLLTSGKLDDPRLHSKFASKWRQHKDLSDKQKEEGEMYSQIANEMTKDGAKDGDATATAITTLTTTEEQQGNTEKNKLSLHPELSESTQPQKQNQTQTEQAIITQNQATNITLSKISFPKGNNGKQLVLPHQATYEELQKSSQPEEDKLNLQDWKSEMPSHCMEDIDELFRDEEEVKLKAAIFNKMNKEYIEKQERKDKERLVAEAAEKEKEDLDDLQMEEQARYWKRTQKHIGGGNAGNAGANGGSVSNKRKNVSFDDVQPTTEEALYAALSSRKISRKINYDAMSAIFDDSGSFSTDLLEDHEPQKEPEGMSTEAMLQLI